MYSIYSSLCYKGHNILHDSLQTPRMEVGCLIIPFLIILIYMGQFVSRNSLSDPLFPCTGLSCQTAGMDTRESDEKGR